MLFYPFYICLRYNYHLNSHYVDKKPLTTVYPVSLSLKLSNPAQPVNHCDFE